MAELCTGTIAGAPICGLPAGLIAAGATTVGALAGLLALDPSDPNFTQIATPVTPSIPPAGPADGIPAAVIAAANALIQNDAQTVGVEQALLTTLNREQGALDAGNTFWATQQGNAAVRYLGQLAQLFPQMASLITQFQAALTAANLTLSVTPDQVLNFESELAALGFSATETANLQMFGADAALIEEARNIVFVQDINKVAAASTNLAQPTLIALLKSLQVGPPTSIAQCQNGGWQFFNAPEHFKNQGDCIQNVNTGK